MKAIIDDLKKQIDYNNNIDDPIDKVSWNDQYGILISVNDAEKIVHAFTSYVESELTSKLEKIKAELSDEWIKEYLNNHPSPKQREDSKLNKKEYSLMSVSVDAAFISASKWMRDEILNRLK